GRTLEGAVLKGASERRGSTVTRLSELGEDDYIALSPEEQYLVASGRTYFRELAFDDLHRMQFDLETTGLNPARDQIFLVAVRHTRGLTGALGARGKGRAAGAALIRALVVLIRWWAPDVIENHTPHGFALPFLAQRARQLGVRLPLGRLHGVEVRTRPAARGY